MPVVVDADALWALAQDSEWQKVEHAGPRVLTPHAGELQYLHGDNPSRSKSRPKKDLEFAATRLAKEAGIVIVLKGPASLVTDGTINTHNETGNPGMATAGTGDVLTGIITALVAQQLSIFDAARLGTWIHGAAGDAASIECGEYSLTASQVIGCLPISIKRCVAT